MKKMAGMQAHIVSDPLSRQALDRQMTTWEENLERLYIEQFSAPMLPRSTAADGNPQLKR